jgi:hypothetical protein
MEGGFERQGSGMRIVDGRARLSIGELNEMAKATFGDLVKENLDTHL